MDFSYFFYFGLFDLAILTYLDVTRGTVQSRYNWFMGGIVGSMIVLQHPPIWYIAVIIVTAAIVAISAHRALGMGDTESTGWVVSGCGFISIPRLLVFLMFFAFLIGVHVVTKRALKIPRSVKLPALPIYFGAFLITAIVVC